MFATLAWYNKMANQAFYKVLSEHPAVAYEEGTTYFGSLLDLFSHIASADRTWFQRIGADGPAEEPLHDLDGWYAYREQFDRHIETYCQTLSMEAISGEVTYRNSAGSEFHQPLWQILLHLFNHQTHHRGQAAQVLDERKVENDLSNLIWYVRK